MCLTSKMLLVCTCGALYWSPINHINSSAIPCRRWWHGVYQFATKTNHNLPAKPTCDKRSNFPRNRFRVRFLLKARKYMFRSLLTVGRFLGRRGGAHSEIQKGENKQTFPATVCSQLEDAILLVARVSCGSQPPSNKLVVTH